MDRRTARTALVTAVVAGGTGVLLLATPVLAGTGWGHGTGAGTRTTAACPMGDGRPDDGTTDPQDGTDVGRGRGMGGGTMRGSGGPAANLPARGTLTDAQKSALVGMAEEEKLAHDAYVVLAASSGDPRFAMVARAESHHLDAVRVLLTRYGVTDPTAGKADGAFASATVQTLYGTLVARGKASPAAALEVARTVETTDIADLAKAGSGVTAADVTTVYQRLSAASEHHLVMFGG